MNSNDWKGLVGSLAPTVASLFGGPAAGMAVSVLSQAVLGKPDATESDLKLALANPSPEILARIKEAEVKLKTELAAAGIKLAEIQARDRDSARNREIQLKDPTPHRLAYIVLIVFALVLAIQGYIAVKGIAVPVEAQRTVDITLGVLFAWVLAVKDYFFGSSSSSRAKDDTISKLSE